MKKQVKKTSRAEKLIKGHPKLFPKGFGIECGEGWLELIDLVCHYFENKLRVGEVKEIQFAQIKEKFGLLRIYFDVQFPANLSKIDKDNRIFYELHNTISTMEAVSGIVCEGCGKIRSDKINVEMRTLAGWKMTNCDKCWEGIKKRHDK